MRRAYKAMLRGDRVEWLDGAPDIDGAVQVFVTLSDGAGSGADQADQAEGKSAFESLQALADMGAFDDIDDPVAWQRELRRDRPMPLRDCDVD